MEKVKCKLCYDMCDKDAMTVINDIGTQVCPRCIFIMGLYITRGINKKYSDGCLMPHCLNREFKKILTEEFYKDPQKTYRKYLHDLIDKEELSKCIIHPNERDFKKVNDGAFPFILLNPDRAKKLKAEPGRRITLRTDEHDDICREIVATHILSAKDAKRYGYAAGGRAVACFIPPEE